MIRGKSCFEDLAAGAEHRASPRILNRLVLQADLLV